MAQQSSQRKKEGRGTFLAILLVLDSLWIFSGILFLPHKLYMIIFLHQMGIWWDTLLSLIIPPLGIAIVIGIWTWKKIAVYAHFAYLSILFASLIVPIFLAFPENQYGAWMVVFALVILGVWYVAIKPKWHLFT